MSIKINTISFLILCSLAGFSQELEVGLYGGASYYLGDLNPGGHFRDMQLAYGLVARYPIDDRWAVKLSAYRGKIQGDAANSGYLPERELNFESAVTDISGVAEFNFLRYFTGSRRDFISPYVYAGIGVVFFNPYANGVKLRPLGTEGQNIGYEGRRPYRSWSVSIPFGIGVKVSVSQRIGLTAFWELHKSLTDYLDDISTTYYLNGTTINPENPEELLSDPTMSYSPGMQRGNSKTQDWYSFTGITITYKFALTNGKKCKDLYSE